MIERGHHDLGGLPAGKIERKEGDEAHDYAEWERRVDAMVQLLRFQKKITVDEVRKNIEALPPQAYRSMSYYEKWIASLAQTLLQRGIVTTEEIARKMTEIDGRG